MKLHPSVEPLVADIDSFIERTGMTPTAFGIRVSNDGNLVRDLRGGRRLPSLTTIDRIREFIARSSDGSAA